MVSKVPCLFLGFLVHASSKLDLCNSSRQHHIQWLIQGEGGGGDGGLYSPFGVIFTKAKFTSKKIVLNEYEIYLKMLDLAILGIRKLAPSALVGAP